MSDRSLKRGDTHHPESWEALVEKLKSSSPDPLEAEDLAKELGLDPGFVEDVVKAADAPVASADVWQEIGKFVASTVREFGKGLKEFFEVGIQRPPLFLTATLIILAALIHLTLYTSGIYTASGDTRVQLEMKGVVAAAFQIILALQLFAFARWAKYTRAIFSAIGFFLLLLPAAIILDRVSPAGRPQVLFWMAALSIAGFCIAYLVLISLATLFGSWVQLKRADRTERKMSRQEMLSRLYELNDQVRRVIESRRTLSRRKTFKEWARSSSVFPLWGVLYGLGFGVVEVVIVGTLSVQFTSTTSQVDMVSLAQGFFNFLSIAVFGFLAYLSGGMWRGVVTSVVANGGRLLATLIPIGIYGLDFLRGESRREIFYVLMLIGIIVGALGGAAGQIEKKSARSRRLGANDPATLVAEIVRLERRLRKGQQAACVMAVDVARSTFIKADADPLAIEFSFREYQAMVARVSEMCGGEVFATAGDGAMASFAEPAEALRAAKTIQSQMNDFNDDVNRLSHPFRVRIGLHAGQTQAEFSEAPFNELIDVAAHVESASPIGGIACTESFRRLLPEEEMAEIARQVDGHKVSIVLSPILSE